MKNRWASDLPRILPIHVAGDACNGGEFCRRSWTGLSSKQCRFLKERIRQSMQEAVQKNPRSYAAGNVCGRTERLEVQTLNGETTRVHGEWERDVAQFLNRNKIQWTNDVSGFPYPWNGATHQYFPDFHLPDRDLYIEVKGYERERDRAKWTAFPETLVLIRRDEIEQIRNGTYELGP